MTMTWAQTTQNTDIAVSGQLVLEIVRGAKSLNIKIRIDLSLVQVFGNLPLRVECMCCRWKHKGIVRNDTDEVDALIDDDVYDA